QRHVVELDVRGSERSKVPELGAVDRGDVGEELLEVRIRAVRHPGTPPEEMLGRWARQRDLRGPPSERSDEAELLGRDASMADEPVGHDGGAVAKRLALGAVEGHLRAHLPEAADGLAEVAEVEAPP